MKKPYKFTEKSHLDCQTTRCRAKLKMNVVARKLETPTLCYKCFKKKELVRRKKEW